MSSMPAAANTSASPSLAQQMPIAPRSICQPATTGDLCVLACGRSRMPAALAICCTRSMLFRSRGRSMTTCGVGRLDRSIANAYTSGLRSDKREPRSLSGFEQAREFFRPDRVAGKDRGGVGNAEVPRHDFAEDVAEVGRDGKIAALVAGVHRETRPPAVDAAAANAAADDQHRVAVAVIGAAAAVLVDRPAELRHRH